MGTDNQNLYIWLRDDMDVPSDPGKYQVVERDGRYFVQRFDEELGWADLCEEVRTVRPLTFDSHDAAQLFIESSFGGGE